LSESGPPLPALTHGRVIAAAKTRAIDALLRRVASSTIPALILGETGVGKELIASSLHQLSPRRDGPFVSFNCAALSESLLESELFGYDRGAFTGAVCDRPGLLESAHGGTVFLDEVGEMSLTTQAKLLRAFEAKEVIRVGSVRPRRIDVRFVSATNRNLRDAVREGRFREDFYFRLNGVAVYVPPLRERPEEIEPLARYFLARLGVTWEGGQTPSLSPAAVQALAAHRWPGNVRELRTVMERAVLLCDSGMIGPEHLQLETPSQEMPAVKKTIIPPDTTPAPWVSEQAADEAAERQRIIDALTACAGNQSRAAELLGMPRRTFVKKLSRYQVPRPRDPQSAGSRRRLRLV
jgi:two-component system, NtrC family, response regulator AtoC